MKSTSIHEKPPSAVELESAFKKALPSLTYFKNIDAQAYFALLLQLLVVIPVTLKYIQIHQLLMGVFSVIALGGLLSFVTVGAHLYFLEVRDNKREKKWDHLWMGFCAIAVFCELFIFYSSLKAFIVYYQFGGSLISKTIICASLIALTGYKVWVCAVKPLDRINEKLHTMVMTRPIKKTSYATIHRLAQTYPEVSNYLSKVIESKRLLTKGELWMLTSFHLSQKAQLTYNKPEDVLQIENDASKTENQP